MWVTNNMYENSQHKEYMWQNRIGCQRTHKGSTFLQKWALGRQSCIWWRLNSSILHHLLVGSAPSSFFCSCLLDCLGWRWSQFLWPNVSNICQTSWSTLNFGLKVLLFRSSLSRWGHAVTAVQDSSEHPALWQYYFQSTHRYPRASIAWWLPHRNEESNHQLWISPVTRFLAFPPVHLLHFCRRRAAGCLSNWLRVHSLCSLLFLRLFYWSALLDDLDSGFGLMVLIHVLDCWRLHPKLAAEVEIEMKFCSGIGISGANSRAPQKWTPNHTWSEQVWAAIQSRRLLSQACPFQSLVAFQP